MRQRVFPRSRTLASLLLFVFLLLTLVGCAGGNSGANNKGIKEKSLSELPEVVGTAKGKASEAARDGNLKTINDAIRAYFAENGSYPASLQELVPDYLSGIPIDPLGGSYYITFEYGEAKAAVR